MSQSKQLFRATALTLSSVLISSCALVGGVFGVRSAYDEPTYRVVDKLADGSEIRIYDKRLIAEVSVPNRGEDGENDAFRYLFDYITGENTSAEKIAMTVPVNSTESSYNSTTDASDSEKIAMTVPVQTSEPADSGMTMQFFFPPEYTLENAPVPSDEKVSILELPEQTFAVKDMSGWKGRDSLDKAKEKLQTTVKESDYEAQGKPSTLFYDPPFTIPYLRKTEVIIQVESTDQ